MWNDPNKLYIYSRIYCYLLYFPISIGIFPITLQMPLILLVVALKRWSYNVFTFEEFEACFHPVKLQNCYLQFISTQSIFKDSNYPLNKNYIHIVNLGSNCWSLIVSYGLISRVNNHIPVKSIIEIFGCGLDCCLSNWELWSVLTWSGLRS